MKKSMPYFFLYLLCCTPLFAGTNPEWRKVDSIPYYIDSTNGNVTSTRWYRKMSCADSLHCALIGSGLGEWYQFIRSTTNGGESWQDIYLDSSIFNQEEKIYYQATQLIDIAHPSPNLIIAVGDSGRIVRSTNNGLDWEAQRLGQYDLLLTIKMYDENYGIINGQSSVDNIIFFYETTDGGKNWRKMKTPKDLIDGTWFEDYHILRPGYFVIVLSSSGGKDPRIMHVHGDWDSIIVYPQPDKYRKYFIYFSDESHGWILGAGKPDKENPTAWDQNQEIFYTNDGGKNWTKQLDTLFFYGLSLVGTDFYNDRFGIATSVYGYAYFTHNGGRTWELIHIDDNPWGAAFNIHDPQLTSYSSGYAIVDLQYVYKFTRDWSIPHDTTGSPDDSVKSFFPSPPPGENLLGAYPNPFSEKTKILYYLAAPSRATITIFDLQGNELETLFDDFAGEGFHEIEYINKGLSPGFYYYRLRAGGKVVTRKFIVIK